MRSTGYADLVCDLIRAAIISAAYRPRRTVSGIQRELDRRVNIKTAQEQKRRQRLREEIVRIGQSRHDRFWLGGAPARVSFEAACGAVGVDADAVRSKLRRDGIDISAAGPGTMRDLARWMGSLQP